MPLPERCLGHGYKKIKEIHQTKERCPRAFVEGYRSYRLLIFIFKRLSKRDFFRRTRPHGNLAILRSRKQEEMFQTPKTKSQPNTESFDESNELFVRVVIIF